MANQRYKIVEGSQSSHCCFGYTIVDTHDPIMHGEKQSIDWRTGEPRFNPLCECWEEDEAILIRDALNAL